MAGIYIHIPFCKQACSYCDFHFSTKLSNKTKVLESILKELEQRSNYLEGETLDTVYFGGGTPSLLNQTELNQILNKVRKSYTLNAEVEFCLEANPDDLNKEKLTELKDSGINRLSIGVQSFHDADLKFMNRAHNSSEALACIQNAKAVGFNNISIDLIFGSQTTTDEMWQKNLDESFALGIDHLSAYSLTIEEKTALSHQVEKGKIADVDDEKNYRHYLMLQQAIADNGYEQYELSNYCRNKAYSKHNTAYWQGKKYLGIGPSAHSFNGVSRQWNVKNNSIYSKAIHEGKDFFEKEILSELDRYHELLLTKLRTKWGLAISEVDSHFSPKISQYFQEQLKKFNSEIADVSNGIVKVKAEHLFQSDEVVRHFMMDA